jgi:tetratricopeptide (TPR) repeat protein
LFRLGKTFVNRSFEVVECLALGYNLSKDRKYLEFAKEHQLSMSYDQAIQFLSDSFDKEFLALASQPPEFAVKRENIYAIVLFLAVALNTEEDWPILYLIGLCHLYENHLYEAVKCFAAATKLHTYSPLRSALFMNIGSNLWFDYHNVNGLNLFKVPEDRLFTVANILGLIYNKYRIDYIAVDWFNIAREALITSAQNKVFKKEREKRAEDSANGREPIEDDNWDWIEIRIKEALRADLNYAELMNNIGLYYLNRDKHFKAKAYFEDAISYTPDGVNYPEPRQHLDKINIYSSNLASRLPY